MYYLSEAKEKFRVYILVQSGEHVMRFSSKLTPQSDVQLQKI